jgi:uncharacterized protein (TIGR03086 family)
VLTFDLLTGADDGFTQRLALVRPHQWTAPTPCPAWDVQALVNHVVGANRRYTMLLDGAAADEVDATRSADHLGADPVASFVSTAAGLHAAFRQPGALARTAQHPIGERTGAQLLDMRVLDVAVHSWDLARAIGTDETLDPDVVAFALTLQPTLEVGRQRGSFAPPPGATPPTPHPKPVCTTWPDPAGSQRHQGQRPGVDCRSLRRGSLAGHVRTPQDGPKRIHTEGVGRPACVSDLRRLGAVLPTQAEGMARCSAPALDHGW